MSYRTSSVAISPLQPTVLPSTVAKSSYCTNPASSLTVKFWGVRGSIPTPGSDTTNYGGNTACVEVLAAGHRFIFDGGTGLRVLGEHLHHCQEPIEAHLFFTHTQWDRIQGFPFFLPAFSPQNHFTIYGAVAPNGASIKQRLCHQMLRPNFSIPLQEMRAHLEFRNICAGSIFQIEDVLIETISLNPASHALGYRLNYNGRSLVYATDTSDHTLDPNLMYLAQQADILIYDGTYADLHYPTSNQPATEVDVLKSAPWQNAIALAKTVDLGQLVLFHYGPNQTDVTLDQLAAELQPAFSNIFLAREGMSIEL